MDVLEDLRPTYHVFEPGPGGWTERAVPGLPALGSVHLWPLDGDPEASGLKPCLRWSTIR